MTDLYVKGNVHMAPFAVPPEVKVAQGVDIGLVCTVVVSGGVVVSHTVPKTYRE